jgi:hypothetical protein
MDSPDDPSLVLSCPRCRTFVQVSAEDENTVCWQCLAHLRVRRQGRDVYLEVGAAQAASEPQLEAAAPLAPDAGVALAAAPPPRPGGPSKDHIAFRVLTWLFIILTVSFIVVLRGVRGEVARSADGRLEIALPSGWRQSSGPDSSDHIAAGNASGTEWLFVRSAPKPDFRDLASYHGYWTRIMLVWLREARPTSAERTLLNGQPALRSEITGMTPQGMRLGYVMLAVETETRFSEVFVSTARSRFPERRSALAHVADGFHEIK